MKICVLAPSQEYLNQAGVRIRYRRLEGPLAAMGHELSVVPIDRFQRREEFVHDVYFVSKCYDGRSLIAAQHIAARGRLVGIDLFDDYFSQVDDSRFARLRLWLHQLLSSAGFLLFATEAMRARARQFAPDCPAHVMNDPFDRFDSDRLAATLDAKLSRLHQTKVLDVAWFGMGDNPHFPIGLSDLVAFGNDLSRLRGQGFDVRLHILTNDRAVTARTLIMLRRLAVPYTLEEWNEAREAALLERCSVCFLPVNAQAFSVVKSLNRGITALMAGAQVLSAGFPLYEALSDFIYRDAKALLDDLKQGRPLLRSETLETLKLSLARLASPDDEARRLIAFLESARQPSPAVAPLTVAAIHGRESSGDVHKFALRMGGLSVASPFANPKLNYDLRFAWREGGPGIDVLIASKKRHLLPAEIAEASSAHGRILDTDYHRLQSTQLRPCSEFSSALGRLKDPVAETAVYGEVMSLVRNTLLTLMPGVACVFSETSKLPLRMPVEARVA